MLSSDERKHDLVHKASTYLKEMAAKLKDGSIDPALANRHLDVTWSVMLDSDVANTIIRAAENGDAQDGSGSIARCDGIAMSTHGMSGIRRWAMGSVTERVMYGTRLPLLITRPAWVEENVNQEAVRAGVASDQV
jgi:nucleotide-binding universal stress UspA family protein